MKKLIHYIKSSSYRVYIIPTLCVLFIAASGIWVLFPQAISLFEKNDLLISKNSELSELRKKRVALDAVTTDSSLKNLTEAEIALPHEKDPASVIISFENLSASTQLVSSGINLTPGVVSTVSGTNNAPLASDDGPDIHGAHALVFSLNLFGSLDKHLAFIAEIERSRRMFDITSLKYSFQEDQKTDVTAEYFLIAYYQPPITEIGDVSAPLPPITPEEVRLLAELATYPVISRSLQVDQGLTEPIGKTNLFVN